MKQYQQEDFHVNKKAFDDTPIQNKLDIAAIVFRQMQQTNYSATLGEELFAQNVRILMSYIPSYKREEILKRSDEYNTTTKTLQFKHWCGVPLGTEEHPINGSPFWAEEQVIDWHKLYEIILDTFEDCNVTWKFDKTTTEIGAVAELEKQETAIPTPIFIKDVPEEVEVEEIIHQEVKEETKPKKQKNLQTCAFCNEVVKKGTGTRKYFHKLLHKNECVKLAKLKWQNGTP